MSCNIAATAAINFLKLDLNLQKEMGIFSYKHVCFLLYSLIVFFIFIFSSQIMVGFKTYLYPNSFFISTMILMNFKHSFLIYSSLRHFPCIISVHFIKPIHFWERFIKLISSNIWRSLVWFKTILCIFHLWSQYPSKSLLWIFIRNVYYYLITKPIFLTLFSFSKALPLLL